MGRFINLDGLIGEIGNILGHNVYAYTENNPVAYVDPTGYCVQATLWSWGSHEGSCGGFGLDTYTICT